MNNITDYELISQKKHIKYWNDLKIVAGYNRKCLTRSEAKLWYEVLNNRKTGYKFTRQKPVNRFVLDFYCSELLLAIEVDGGYHKNRLDNDKKRDSYLNCLNILTIRFTNNEILIDLENTKLKLGELIKIRIASLSREVDSAQQKTGV